jgi:hypothetical protein
MHQLQPNLSHFLSLSILEDRLITAQSFDHRLCQGSAYITLVANLPNHSLNLCNPLAAVNVSL